MFYIVGLGNPGEKYARTRHNVAWMALDSMLQAWGMPSLIPDTAVSGRTTSGYVGDEEVRVLYPDTFMNNSGAAVKKFVPKDASKQLIVIHDDIDLPFGEIKIAHGRGSGGNNGVTSVINKLGTKDFIRVRIGIAPTSFWTGKIKRPSGGGPLERFVLKEFSRKEAAQLPDVLATTQSATECIIKEGVAAAMNQYN